MPTPGRAIGISLIHAYRGTLSPLIGSTCRYLPTCSHYTEDAIRQHGFWAGTWMGVARFQRCGPNGPAGYDPVPEEKPAASHWYAPWRYGDWKGAHIPAETRLDLPD